MTDDAYTKRLIELAETTQWPTDRTLSLLARVLLYAEQEQPPSGGLCADIEIHLAEHDAAFLWLLRDMSVSR